MIDFGAIFSQLWFFIPIFIILILIKEFINKPKKKKNYKSYQKNKYEKIHANNKDYFNTKKENIFEENLKNSEQKYRKEYEEKVKINEYKYFSNLKKEANKENNYKEKKLTYKEKIEKGKKFELQVVEYFEINGYEVEHRGKTKGRKDKGIDILAKKDNTYYLIQCKNYAETTKIKHNIIKEFNSNCLDFLNQNDKKLNKENTKFLFILSNRKSLKKCAIHYLKDNNNKCEFQEVGFVS